MYVGVPPPPRGGGARRLTALPADPKVWVNEGGGVPSPPSGARWGTPPPSTTPEMVEHPSGLNPG